MKSDIVDLTTKVNDHKQKLERLTITPKEFSKVLGVGINKAYQILKSNNAPRTIKVGNRMLIPVKELDKWLDEAIGKEF